MHNFYLFDHPRLRLQCAVNGTASRDLEYAVALIVGQVALYRDMGPYLLVSRRLDSPARLTRRWLLSTLTLSMGHPFLREYRRTVMAVQVPRADRSSSYGSRSEDHLPPSLHRLVGDEGVIAGYDKLLEVLNALHRDRRHHPHSLLVMSR